MGDRRKLSIQQNGRLVPIITSCMETTQNHLTELTESPIRFTNIEGFIVDNADAERLERAGTVVALFKASGDVDGAVGLLSPVSLAITLSQQIAHTDEPAPEEAPETLTDAQLESFKEVCGILGAGLDSALSESSVYQVDVALSDIKPGNEWAPEDAFDDTDLVAFETNCKVANAEPQTLMLLFSRKFIKNVTGLSVSEAGDSEVTSVRGEGATLRRIVAVELDPQETALLQSIVDSMTMQLTTVDNVRNLLFTLVNEDCDGIVIGDRSSSPDRTNLAPTVATTKRLRSTPHARTTPISFLVRWPTREQIMELAQLGAADIVVLPTSRGNLENRLRHFLTTSIPD